jgi:DNA polymerase III alpha subunit
MGLKYVKSVGEDDAEAVVAEREANGPFADVGDLSRRVPLDARELEALLRSGACDRWGRRRDLLWELGLAIRPRTVERTQGRVKQAKSRRTPRVCMATLALVRAGRTRGLNIVQGWVSIPPSGR